MLFSALFFALHHTTAKKIMKHHGAVETLFVSALAAAILYLPSVFFIDLQISLKHFSLIVAVSVIVVIAVISLFQAYKESEISLVGPMLNLSPILLVIGSYIFLGEILNIIQISGIVLVIAGGYLLTLRNPKNIFQPFTALKKRIYVLILITLVMYTVGGMMWRVLLLEMDPYVFTFYFFMMYLFVLSFVMTLKGKWGSVVKMKSEWKLILFTGIFLLVSDLINIIVFNMPETMVSLALSAKRVSALFMVLLGGTIFKEKNIKMKILASSIMVLGVFIIGFTL